MALTNLKYTQDVRKLIEKFKADGHNISMKMIEGPSGEKISVEIDGEDAASLAPSHMFHWLNGWGYKRGPAKATPAGSVGAVVQKRGQAALDAVANAHRR